MSSIAALVFALIMPGLASPVPGPPPPDAPVEAAQRRAVVQALAQALRGHYVFPEVAERAARDPTGRAINPITRTNWEGTGVKPDLPTPAANALKVAHLRALRAILKAETDGRRRQALEQTLALVEKGDARRPDYTRRD